MTLSGILDKQEAPTPEENSIGYCLAKFPKQCSDALFFGRNLSLSVEKKVKAVFICGVGGSALAGDLVAAIGELEGKIPFFVIRNYQLPAWADENSLIIAISYSGNTEEVLACYDRAKELGATLLAVTSGGKLQKKAMADGILTIDAPKGFQPRMATLHMALPLLLLLNNEGILYLPDAAIVEAYTTLCQSALRWGEDNPSVKNRAKATAVQLYKKTTLIWGSAALTQLGARNFKNQLNETAKAPAFYGTVPEVNHNEIMSVGQGANTALVFLRCRQENPRIAKGFEIAKTILVDKVAVITEVPLPGEHLLTSLCSSLLFGDLTAYYLSRLNKVDPEAIEAIRIFKARMLR